MKKILDYHSFINENINEGITEAGFAYSKDWIEAFTKNFDCSVSMDKVQNIKPLYGGGDWRWVGFILNLNNPIERYDQILVEGMMCNGMFLKASAMLGQNGTWIVHGGLRMNIGFGELRSENIDSLISALQAFLHKHAIG